MEDTSKIFLGRIKKKINEGGYDEYLTLPFMSKNKLYFLIEKKVNEREESGSTPILTKKEIETLIEDMKEVSVFTFHLFVKNGFLQKTEKGWGLTKKGAIAIRQSILSK